MPLIELVPGEGKMDVSSEKSRFFACGDFLNDGGVGGVIRDIRAGLVGRGLTGGEEGGINTLPPGIIVS